MMDALSDVKHVGFAKRACKKKPKKTGTFTVGFHVQVSAAARAYGQDPHHQPRKPSRAGQRDDVLPLLVCPVPVLSRRHADMPTCRHADMPTSDPGCPVLMFTSEAPQLGTAVIQKNLRLFHRGFSCSADPRKGHIEGS